jgi:hypothetical protein
MAKIHTAFVVGVTLLAGAPPPAVQEPDAARTVAGSATTAWLVPPGKDPYGNIFFSGPRSDLTFQRAQGDTFARPSDPARPRIVCGMTVVPVKPDSDPKMVRSPKPDSNVEYKMRVVSPRICRE